MVRTRFAPSPTGYLHIGGVRTALYNWLYARQHGGQFILRIDDTDQQRNVEEALRPILDGLRWLGIDWDEGPDVGGPLGPYYQSQRTDRYQAAVERLLASGHAYRDYATTEEIQAERSAAEKEKRTFRYSRRFMAETTADREQFEAEGRKAVVRLKMPLDGKLVLDDEIRGRVEFDWSNEQDHVIQRNDGSCLYHLANVVDDHDLEITHVIRAEEHLSNTPRQVFIVESLGYPRPTYAHLPFVAEPGSHNKLSKRKLNKYLKNRDFADLLEHGRKIAEAIGHKIEADAFNPVIVDFYETVGFLPEAIVNYLALLGWALDDKTEHFSRDELIAAFSLDRVNKAPASFDPKKLMSFEDRHFQKLTLEQKAVLTTPFLEKAKLVASPPTPEQCKKIDKVIDAAGDRIKMSGDILEFYSLVREKPPIDPNALKKALKEPAETIKFLTSYQGHVSDIKPFNATTCESDLSEFAASSGVTPKEIIYPLRVALTGSSTGFGLYETLDILGPEASGVNIQNFLDETNQLGGQGSKQQDARKDD